MKAFWTFRTYYKELNRLVGFVTYRPLFIEKDISRMVYQVLEEEKPIEFMTTLLDYIDIKDLMCKFYDLNTRTW